MRGSRALPLVLVVMAVARCSDANKNTYAQAAAATGIQVAMVGMYRAITRECWGICSPGWVCNQESGLCERGECVPACEFGSHCTRSTLGELYCARDSGGAGTQSSLRTTSMPVAAVADAGIADSGAADAATQGSADAAADASALP